MSKRFCLKLCQWITLVSLIGFAQFQTLGWAESPAQIRSVALNSLDKAIVIKGNHHFNPANHFTALKLPNPYRLIVDIPDAELATSNNLIPINQAGIRTIELSETRGTYYNATRVTVYVDDYATLNALNPILLDKTISIGLTGGVPTAINPPASFPTPAPVKTVSGQNRVDNVSYQNDQLLIEGANNARLTLKNRFVLQDPKRLVIDLDNAALANKQLSKTFSVSHPNIHQIRIGQFDENTVRIVIAADMPERLQIAYPQTDKTLISVADGSNTAMNTLPSNIPLGKIQGISVGNNDDNTVIRLMTSVPMVQQVVRDQGKIYVQLANISATPGWVPYNRETFPQLDYLKIESLNADQPNSKLVIDPKSSETEMSTHLSPDGRTLELTLFNPNESISALSWSGNRSMVPFKARVVIDAGHGGKDLGANRSGINEKDLNLAVAHRLRQALEARGVKVYMTRSTDVFLPLPQITQINNDIHPDVFVSVHTNSSTSAAITGVETYYFTPQSISLAKSVHRQLISRISSPDRGVRQARFYVIHHTQIPAILCEMGYISNATERTQLLTEARAQKTADAIAEGVVEYLKSSLSAKAK